MIYTEESVKKGSKKEKRKWCKGRVGEQHDYAYESTQHFEEKFVRNVGEKVGKYIPTGDCFNIYICQKCGRKTYKKEIHNAETHNKRPAYIKQEGRDFYEQIIIEK